jgi:putative membrane protein
MATKGGKNPLGIALRGVAMGAADVIPGVSGGTIAFITGIYEELLETISNLNFGLIKTWRKEGFKAMWKAGNFNFLFALFAGIVLSIASLAILIQHLLEAYPIQVWGFFFGLIVASVWLVGKTVKNWNLKTIAGVIAGTVAAYFITIMGPSEESQNLIYIFICGAIAVCAMILPGISGSFILLLLGAYETVLGAVSDAVTALKDGNYDLVFSNGLTIIVFIAGCLIGLITFSKLLNWLFKKAHDLTIAILTGFLIGSLNKIWPWKKTLEWFTKPDGEMVPLVQENASPSSYTEWATQINVSQNMELPTEPHLFVTVLLAISGLSFILLLEFLGRRSKEKV